MIKHLIGIVLGLSLAGCSSPPKKSYDVTTIQSVSYSLMELADHKRQLQEFDKALDLYLEAERYATMRNDKYLVGLSKLKRAGISIKNAKLNEADALIKQVSQMEQYEQVGLSNAIKYLQAQLAHEQDDSQTAFQLLNELSLYYKDDNEKLIYYNTVRWVYGDPAVQLTQVQQGLQTLESLKKEAKLNNIEILSYALFQLAKHTAQSGDETSDSVLLKSISHFSNLEMSNKVSQSYTLAAQFYARHGNQAKADYYQQQASNITALTMK